MKATLTKNQLKAIAGANNWSNYGKDRTYFSDEIKKAACISKTNWQPYIDWDDGGEYKGLDYENALILDAYLQIQHEKVRAAYEKAKAEKKAEDEKNAEIFREELFAEAKAMTDEDWAEAKRKKWDVSLRCNSVRQIAFDCDTTEEVHEELKFVIESLKISLKKMIEKIQDYKKDWLTKSQALCTIHYIEVYEKALTMEKQKITEWAKASKDPFINHKA